jgi:hypothetical protein
MTEEQEHQFELTPAGMVSLMLRAGESIEDAQRELQTALPAEADLHEVYIRMKAEAWRTVEGRSREEREAYVDDMAREARHKFERAVARSKVAMENVRNKRQKLSALQSAANSIKEEAALARTAP